MNKKANKTSFKVGHKKVGGFHTGSKHSAQSIAKVSASLVGRTGANARRWKGVHASYAAKHLWILKHHGNAKKCENLFCQFKNPRRFEWANISKTYRRERDDYKQLCPSCHRKWDLGMIEL